MLRLYWVCYFAAGGSPLGAGGSAGVGSRTREIIETTVILVWIACTPACVRIAGQRAVSF